MATVLDNDEKLIYTTKPKILPTLFTFETLIFIGFLVLVSIFGSYFTISLWEVILIVLIILIILLPALRNMLKLTSMTYIITNRRILVDSKVSGKDKKDIPLSGIKTVSVNQNLVGLLAGSGTILVKAFDKKIVVRLINVGNCNQVKQKIQKAIDTNK